ncbi:hypothetical protein [Marivita sp. XM-24bin2]|jgi:hypothetical protein|uniref:hypothetical protein n=1 Tax=unclassified Marivita TaxID=2632480 RepID=UPI000D7B50C1|nr:hypothetical protein [Marivita sp. XM-24bin2]MCR9107712.1 hypothetical protein [Paracoccaceae bacterium]PWL34788.1 MAG: hypothetical protein DCO97_12430 [Marivita sp. XM-24bin2]
MTEQRFNSLLTDQDSAALGKVAPAEEVPVGFMVLATCPLILWLLDGTVAGLASAIVIIALFGLGLLCLSVGQKAHFAYDSAEVAARPKIPFKLIGSIIVALVVGLLATTKIGNPAIPMVISLSTFILCLISFGLDPMRHKGLDNPTMKNRIVNIALYQSIDDRCEDLLHTLAQLEDDDLFERTRVAVNTVMGLLGTIDFTTPTIQRIAPSVNRLLDKLQAEVDAFSSAPDGRVTQFQRKKFLIKVQTLVDAFESRARKNGIGRGRDNFELQTDLLFNRMNRHRAA